MEDRNPRKPWVNCDDDFYLTSLEYDLARYVEPNLDCLDWKNPFLHPTDASARTVYVDDPPRKGRGAYGAYWYRGLDGEMYIVSAHVLMYELYHCHEVPEGMLVRHTCDRPRCVHPDHLTLGTHKDNSADMVARGRTRSRLTNRQVREIRDLYTSGNFLQRELAETFEVSETTIYRIVNHKSFRNI